MRFRVPTSMDCVFIGRGTFHRHLLRVLQSSCDLGKDAEVKFTAEIANDLVACPASPYWFGRYIYTPPSANKRGTFTISLDSDNGQSGASWA